FDPYPLAIEAATGATLLDVDGHKYTDILNNYTSLVHGHGYGPAVEAIARATASGTAHPGTHLALLELAELLVGRYPAVERVRFTNSGTEAALLALRMARHYTGRQGVIIFEGGYHGGVPQFLDGDPSVVRLPYNEIGAIGQVVGVSTAAVFVEPFLGSGGVVSAEAGFLEAVRSTTAAAGALMVLDEVQSLRNHYSGMHGALELDPDLVLMGKIIGGGTPVGAVGGRTAVLQTTDPSTRDGLNHSGTFNGNPLTMAAGVAALTGLDSGAIERLNSRAMTLESALEEVIATSGAPAYITRSGSILQIHPGSRTSTPPEAGSDEADMTAALHLALLLEGVYAAPRGMLNLSTALTEDDLQSVVGAYSRALARVHDGWADTP
ncbi:MAG: aminotransferase class III-fold pyridoxal phosphate-dependent enzyme, partial [Candidatus Dormiibacterota bacterium]